MPAPRLRAYYLNTVRANLSKQFGLSNPHEIPNLEKIVLNVGMGEAIKQPKVLDTVVEELSIIAGQLPVRKKAKKSIANYGLRQGQEIGASVTLRGNRMWEFLDRFVTTAIPRIRDFRGLSTRAFDGRGNYSLGVKEQMIFPGGTGAPQMPEAPPAPAKPKPEGTGIVSRNPPTPSVRPDPAPARAKATRKKTSTKEDKPK